MPSFDIVSKVDWAEVDNALNQASKEVAQRFDFKGAEATLEKSEGKGGAASQIVVRASTEDRAQAALGVLREKLIKRKVSLKHLEEKDPEPGPRGSCRLTVLVKEGIEVDDARSIVKLVKDSKLKVQAAIQDKSVRVTGKNRDDLQAAMRVIREAELPVELTFNNFRD